MLSSMTLQELLNSVQKEIASAGLATEGISLNLAFSAKKDRNGEVNVDFVDAGSMSRPKPEEIHRFWLPLSNLSQTAQPVRQVESMFNQGEEPEDIDQPPALRPPSLPPKRRK